MEWYGQNQEDKHIAKYFGNRTGTLLDIGANDGYTLSNTFHLIKNGWRGVMVEPSPKAYDRLQNNYTSLDGVEVELYNVAISTSCGEAVFYQSGSHLSDNDVSLLSTLSKDETKRWGNSAQFEEIKVKTWDYKTLIDNTAIKTFNMINIDAEGNDVDILRQIDLEDTQLVCIEHNSKKTALIEIKRHCTKYNMLEIHINGENIIMAK